VRASEPRFAANAFRQPILWPGLRPGKGAKRSPLQAPDKVLFGRRKSSYARVPSTDSCSHPLPAAIALGRIAGAVGGGLDDGRLKPDILGMNTPVTHPIA